MPTAHHSTLLVSTFLQKAACYSHGRGLVSMPDLEIVQLYCTFTCIGVRPNGKKKIKLSIFGLVGRMSSGDTVYGTCVVGQYFRSNTL